MTQEKKHSGSRSVDGLNSLLLQACGYMREAWRLTIQNDDRKEGKKPALPANLLAAPSTVKLQFYSLETLNRRLDGDLSDMIIDMAQKVEQTAGPIEKWVQPEHVGAVAGSWGSLAVSVVTAIDRALDLSKQEFLSEDNIIGDEWAKAGRAGVALQFACRAVKALEKAIEAGDIPAGSRATKKINADSPVLDIHILNSENLSIGIGSSIEDAFLNARQDSISRKPYSELSLSQFMEISKVIEVESGRGRTGKAKNGPERLLFSDVSSLSNMRFFLGKVFELERREGRFDQTMNRKAWIDQSLRNLMNSHFEGDFKSMSFPGVGHLVFTLNHRVSIQDTLSAIHQGYKNQDQIEENGLDTIEGLDLTEDEPQPPRERLRA